MADFGVNEILDLNANVQHLTRELQGSLPPGLRCAVTIFTASNGPVAFAHMTENRKMISVLETILKKLKEKGDESNSPILLG